MLIDEVLDQLTTYGLQIEQLDVTGTLCRVPFKNSDLGAPGWYVCFQNILADDREVFIGAYGPSIKSPLREQIKLQSPGLDHTAIARAKKQFDEQREHVDRVFSALRMQVAREIWDQSTEDEPCDYLSRKAVAGIGVRYSRGSLVIPMRRVADAELVGLQFIKPNGQKKFLAGSQKKGACHLIETESTDRSVIAVCEGYATGATIHQATSWMVAVAFDAGNLKPVALALKEKYPDARLVVCGDNDLDSKDNPGATAAKDAAQAVECPFVLPDFGGE